MDFKKHLETAWRLTLDNIAALLITTLVMFVVSFFTIGILAPVMMAGYIQAILDMVRTGRSPRYQDLFSQMRLFLPLLGFSIIVFIAVMVGFMLFFLPGVLVVFAVSFGCLFMLPLMTDRQMGLMDALKTSWDMAIKPNVADHVVVVVLFMVISAIGSSVFIGTLFTQPFATVFLASIFLERTATAPAPVQPPPSPSPGGPS